jgi:hypothetical protein
MQDTNQTESEVVAAFEKNSKDEVRVSIDEFHGRKLINMRVFYKDDRGEWRPGRQGLALPIECYRDLADAVLRVGQWLQSHGYLGQSSTGCEVQE